MKNKIDYKKNEKFRKKRIIIHNLISMIFSYIALMIIIFVNESILRKKLYIQVFWSFRSLVVFLVFIIVAFLFGIYFIRQNKRVIIAEKNMFIMKNGNRTSIDFENIKSIQIYTMIDLFLSTGIVLVIVHYIYENKKKTIYVQLTSEQGSFLKRKFGL